MKVLLKVEREDKVLLDICAVNVSDTLYEYVYKFGIEMWDLVKRGMIGEDRVMSSQLGFRIEEEAEKRKKIYRCPVCGDVITEEEYNDSLNSGSMGYCYCECRMDEDGHYNRTLNEYEVFVKEEG